MAAILLAAIGHDLIVPIPRQFSTRMAVAGITGYQQVLSPRLRGTIICRFRPSCSAYGLASVRKYGGLRGGWRTVKRIARCNPWTRFGTVDLP